MSLKSIAKQALKSYARSKGHTAPAHSGPRGTTQTPQARAAAVSRAVREIGKVLRSR